jgi:3-oxoadipate enol-lactonase
LILDSEKHRVEHRAWQDMAGRLGSAFPQEGFEWWTRFMSRTAVLTEPGFMGTVACANIRANLPRISCPTVVITTEQSGLAPVEEAKSWQQQILD